MRMQFYANLRNSVDYSQSAKKKITGSSGAVPKSVGTVGYSDPRDLIIKQKVEAALKNTGDEKIAQEIDKKVYEYLVFRAMCRDMKCPEQEKTQYKMLIQYLNQFI